MDIVEDLRDTADRITRYTNNPHDGLMFAAADEIDRLRAEVAELQALSVTNILIDVVPGEDGMGLEVYAKSVADVECEFSSMVDRIESLEQQRDAALAKDSSHE